MPKFQDEATWRQAEMLMQPAFIRLIDNIRKQLEQSSWRGTYEDVQMWPEGVTEATKFRVNQLRAELENAPSPERAAVIEQALGGLPVPFPGYHLNLEAHDHKVTLDLWELCYQVCFQDYDAVTGTSHSVNQAVGMGVAIDASLFDDLGEVDWQRLDDKTQQLVEAIFARLPAEGH